VDSTADLDDRGKSMTAAAGGNNSRSETEDYAGAGNAKAIHGNLR
jgi:hypothetical protein